MILKVQKAPPEPIPNSICEIFGHHMYCCCGRHGKNRETSWVLIRGMNVWAVESTGLENRHIWEGIGGSNPPSSELCFFESIPFLFLGGLTQLVEYLAYNEAVSGSSPLTPKHSYLGQKADMVKLVDTLDLGSRSLTTLRVQVLLSVKWRV